jgi:hypothetical protein
MHPLMAAILLRVAGLDPLDLDAEPEPPDRQPAQSKQGIGTGKGTEKPLSRSDLSSISLDVSTGKITRGTGNLPDVSGN